MFTLKLLRYGVKGHVALEGENWQEMLDKAAKLYPHNTSHDFLLFWRRGIMPLRRWIRDRGIRDPWINRQGS